MEDKKLISTISLVVAIVVISVISALIIGSITSSSIFECTNITSFSNDTLLTQSTYTLSPVGDGITSSEVIANNQTWINCTTDDYLLINSDITESITFWYKNETSDWFFVSNSSGTLYTDAVANSPVQYPIYYNGTSYFLCKEDVSTFFNGSIDDFRIYNSTLESTLISMIYSEGRL